MATIEYFYSAHSAFAYLGSRRLGEIAAAHGRAVEHRPMHLHEVMAAAGGLPFRERSAAHRRYFFEREIMRWSEIRGAPVFGRPTHHDNDYTRANRVLIAATQGGANVDALAHALLEAHWRDDADLADEGTLRRLAAAAGFDATALLAAADGEQAVEAHAHNTREAVERGVMGSPTYVVDGDLFYGQDRLEQVERALTRPFSRSFSGARRH